MFSCCYSETKEEHTVLLPQDKSSEKPKKLSNEAPRVISTTATSGKTLEELQDNDKQKTQQILNKLTPILQSSNTPVKTKQSEEEEDSTFQCLALLGTIQLEKGNHEEALQLLKRALTLRIERFGEFGKKSIRSLPYEIHCYTHIIQVLCTLGRMDEAVVYSQKALEARIIYYGTENHEEVARDVNGLAQLFLCLRKYEEALTYFLRGAKIHSEIYGEEHPYIADNFNYIGITLSKLERFEEAWDYLQKSLLMRKKIHGNEHKATKETNNTILNFYWDILKRPDYEVIIDKIVQLITNAYTGKEGHFETVKFLGLIGSLLQQLGKQDEGQIYLLKALELSYQE